MTRVKKVKNPIVGDGTTMYYPEDSTYSYGNWFPTREQQDYINNRGKGLKKIEVSKNKNYTGKITEPFIQNGDTIMWDLMPNNYKSLFISTPEGRMELYMPKRDKNGNTEFQGWDTPETKKYNRAFDAVMSTWFPNLYQNNVRGLESTRLDNSVYKEKYGGSTQFKCGGMKRVPRKKAFWGTFISTLGALGSTAINAIFGNKQMDDNERRYQEQKAFQEKQIKKNELYNRVDSDVKTYLALSQNNDVYDKIRSAKYGGKIKRKKAAFGAHSTDLPFNIINTLGTEKLNLNLPDVYSNNNNLNLDALSNAIGAIGNISSQITDNVFKQNLSEQSFKHNLDLQKQISDSKFNKHNNGLNINDINNTRNLIANNLNNATYNTYNTQMNELQKRRRGQLNSLYLS